MRIRYDSEVDALGILFLDATVSTQELAEGINADQRPFRAKHKRVRQEKQEKAIESSSLHPLSYTSPPALGSVPQQACEVELTRCC
jgi:hypothetical protein